MVRADQHVFAQAKIVLDVGEATPVNPSQVGFYRTDRAPTLLTPPVGRTVTGLLPRTPAQEWYKSTWSRHDQPPCRKRRTRVFGPRLGIAISSPVRPDFTLIG
jgi:hypothetical protein